MSQAGEVLLALAALASLAALTASLAGLIARRPTLERLGLWSLGVTLAVVAAAFFLLLAEFLLRDFGNAYVYEHSSRALPWAYTVSAVWAGNAGSMLLWLFMLAAFSVGACAAAARRGRHVGAGLRRDGVSAPKGAPVHGAGMVPCMAPYMVATLSVMTLFFSLLVLLGPGNNPFVANPIYAGEGLGLNPQLQNPGMVVHPLALYVGYVATAIPFSLMVAGMLSKTGLGGWIGTLRRWTLVAWLFLTIGNVVGAWWAYVTLGWGGYWAWDPVENAALIPWLTATALLHATVMAQREGTQRVWMASLTAATFLLTVLGTFLTRSGVADSVHAFEEPAMIPWFVPFMAIMLILGAAAVVHGLPALRSRTVNASALGESSSFIYANLVFSLLAFVILWGVVFPPLYGAFGRGTVQLADNFFDAVTAPLGLVLLALMAYCPYLRTVRTSLRPAAFGAGITSGMGVIALILLLVLGVRKGYPAGALTLAAMTIVTVIIMYVRGFQAQRLRKAGKPWEDFGRMVWGNRRRYGGFVVHLGLAVLIIGLAGSWAYKQSTEGDLTSGGALTIRDVRVVFGNVQLSSGPERTETRAVLDLYEDGNLRGQLRPSLDYYPAGDRTWTRVARRSSLGGDIYVSLLGVGEQGDTVSIRLELHPLINWLWVGGAIMTLGGVIALWPARERRRDPAELRAATPDPVEM